MGWFGIVASFVVVWLREFDVCVLCFDLWGESRMIESEREFNITRAQAGKFVAALAIVLLGTGVDSDPLLAEIVQKALRSQLEELNQQLEEFERLRSGE